jgi:hypothetical protein
MKGGELYRSFADAFDERIIRYRMLARSIAL